MSEDRQVVQALASFTTNNSVGVPIHVGVGDLFYGDDPIVASRPTLFGDLNVRQSADILAQHRAPARARTETTTAAPGETRAAVTKTGGKLATAGTGGKPGEV